MCSDHHVVQSHQFYIYFNENSVETQSSPEMREVPSPSGGQALVMQWLFLVLYEYKNMQLPP